MQIGGIEQWIQFSDKKPENPVLLYLHGCPGGTSVPVSAAWKPWEKRFTVIHWDQRGAGRTFRKNGAAGCGKLTIERMVRDGLEVAQFLIHTLEKLEVCLVGHSWGSVLGVLMLKRRSELFSAFVGTGQQVNMRKNEEHNYQWTLNQAARLDDREALDALQVLGPPPYADFGSLLALRNWTDWLTDGDGDPLHPCPSPIAPDFTAEDVPSVRQGAQFSREQLLADLNEIDLPSLGRDFNVPMFFFEGTHDH